MAVHDRLRAELTQVLHEVVDERVVVVDHEHPGHAAFFRTRRPGSRAINLSPVPQAKSKRSRYTPPPPKKAPPSPLWFGVAITVLWSAC